MKRVKPSAFGGNLGAGFLIICLPIIVLLLNLICNQDQCQIIISDLPNFSITSLFNLDAIKLVFCWFILHMLFAVLPFGEIKKGLLVKKLNKSLDYRCNAFYVFTIISFVFLISWKNGIQFNWVHRHFIQLAFASFLLSLTLSFLLYIKSCFVDSKYLSEHGNSTSRIYNFWMGCELNPRICNLDLKFACELRPGLIGWAMIDLCFLVSSLENNKFNWALGFVVFGHVIYVADALFNEPAILSTMDITDEGFGYMLVFGDLCWVPFLYSLQARFLYEHPQEWNSYYIIFFFAMFVLGYILFRGSNGQKNKFRNNVNDPSVKHLRTMTTQRGTRLIISGFWGLCRHPNYLGDLIMSLSWSLPSGLNIIPYFYPIYFLILLVNRFKRDDENCRKKYGKDWETYCQIVPYKIFPYIY